jgi:hypothetical protein
MTKTLRLNNLNRDFIKKKIFLVIIIISLSINILNLKNYGYAWDDGLMRLTGFVNLKHIVKIFIPEIEKKYERLKKVSNLNDWRDRYYGPSFELFAAGIETLTGNISNDKSKDNYKNIYYLRCLLLLTILHFSYIFFYKINFYLTKDIFLSNSILLLLLSYPRFFAEQHYNTKDLYLCGLVIMTSYFGLKLINKNKIKYIIFFTFFSALAISTRLSTSLIPIMIMFSHFIYRKNFTLKNLYFYSFNLILFFIFFYISFPFLWENPIMNFLEVFNKLSNHSWSGNVLYFGQVYKNFDAPWHYLLVWFIITTPIIYLIFFLFGTINVLKIVFNFKNLRDHSLNKFILLNFSIFTLTLLTVIIFQNNTYNGWRHSYFIFIFFLIFISCYISTISSIFKLYLSKILIIFLILTNINWIYKNHPYEYVFFNSLVKKPYLKFDLDWWGLTNFDQIRYILKNDTRKNIKIFAASGTSLEATRKTILGIEEKERIEVVKKEFEADYLINNYIGNLEDYSDKYKLINQITVSNQKISSLYKLK